MHKMNKKYKWFDYRLYLNKWFKEYMRKQKNGSK